MQCCPEPGERVGETLSQQGCLLAVGIGIGIGIEDCDMDAKGGGGEADGTSKTAGALEPATTVASVGLEGSHSGRVRRS